MVENLFLTRCKTDDVIPLSDPPFPVYNQADLITPWCPGLPTPSPLIHLEKINSCVAYLQCERSGFLLVTVRTYFLLISRQIFADGLLASILVLTEVFLHTVDTWRVSFLCITVGSELI